MIMWLGLNASYFTRNMYKMIDRNNPKSSIHDIGQIWPSTIHMDSLWDRWEVTNWRLQQYPEDDVSHLYKEIGRVIAWVTYQPLKIN